jgi:signal transduction histidine kinase
LKLYDTEAELEKHIEVLHTQGKYLLDIVNDILDFSKIQAGRMDFYVTQANILPTVDEVMLSFAEMAHKKGVSLEVEKTASSLECYFDDVRVKQIISNLLSNAIKFTKNNSKVSLSFSDEEDFIYLRVSDQGQGISEQDVPKIFNEFETLEKISLHHNGTGLGLPISKKLAEGMGGKIFVKSELGQGAVFTLSLPKNKILDEAHYRTRDDLDYDLIESA